MGHRTIRNHCLSAIAALAALVLPAQAQAWGFYAHTVTADIALENVRPETRAEIEQLLRASPQLGTPECDLASLQDASVWPDCLRGQYWRWGYTFAWHYQTEPITEEYSARKNCSGLNCVSAQVERNQRILADESLPDAVRLEALAFLVHFIGDIHMPLHSGDLADRGGNDRKADYGIVPGLNLHWIWDGPLAERAISEDPPIVRRYSAEERAALAGGNAADWGRESWAISRDFIYPEVFGCDPCEGDLPNETSLSQELLDRSIPIARRRVLQAGLRMAEYLDTAFEAGPLMVEEDRP
ncbi:MAG: S1/P1 nuclease [Erythrobacter sp.]